MIDVKLVSCTNVNPLDLASLAGGICYQSEIPNLGKRMNVGKKLFDVSHHTTVQHHVVSFSVEGISVGGVTFGIHLANPFYNTDQRSGRYCAQMFLSPDYSKMKSYLKTFWPDISDHVLELVIDYVKKSTEIYHANISSAERVAGEFVKEERPFASQKIIGNVPKYAQEQMRSFIPIIFPTALLYTVSDSALVAMYESAWTSEMRYVTGEMARLFTEKFPETAFMFKKERRRRTDWAITAKDVKNLEIKNQPSYELIDVFLAEVYCPPDKDIMFPVDKLHFTPEMMGNSISRMISRIEVSLATMGQNQRHRTISRGVPNFTGYFYLPPIPRKLGLEKEVLDTMNRWIDISKSVPETLAMVLAPYGAMVSYRNSGSLNAIGHEQFKRHCWCAQEEICHLGLLQRFALEKRFGSDSLILRMFESPCYRDGLCSEGENYCGRDITVRKTGNYFPVRKV